MAFPTIDDADTKNGVVTSNSTAWTLTYPTNIGVDDLLLAFVAADGGPTGTWPAGWIPSEVFSGANQLLWAKKKATGSETGNFTLTLSASEQGAWRIFRIPASSWGGNLGTVFANDGNSGDVVISTTIAGSPSNSPNPPSLDPNNWGTEDTLWIAAISVDTSRTISVFPLSDRNTSGVSGGAGGATLGLCTITNTTASLDPGTFTISASDDWAAATIAIRPTGGVPPTPVQIPPQILSFD